jgi:GAF domain-containing protein
MQALARPGSSQELLRALLDDALAGARAQEGRIYLVQRDGSLREEVTVGGCGAAERLRLIGPDTKLPAQVAAQTGEPVWIEDVDDQGGCESHQAVMQDARAVAALPLSANERSLGVMTLGFDHRPRFDEQLRIFLCTVAQYAGLGLARSAETAGDRSEVLPRGAAEARTPRLLDDHSSAARVELAMTSVGMGSFDWDLATGKLLMDERSCEILGIDPLTFDERVETLFEMVLPEDRHKLEEANEASIATTSDFTAEFRLCQPAGEVTWVAARGRTLPGPDGAAARMVGIVRDVTAEVEVRARQHAQDAAGAGRAAFIQAVTRALSEAVTVEDLTQGLTATALPAIGADGMILCVPLPDGRLTIVGSSGYPAETLELLNSHLRLDGPGPLPISVRERVPLFVESLAQYIRLYPDTGDIATETNKGAWAFLPLIASGRAIGSCVFSFADSHAFPTEERTLLTALGGLLGQSLERARLYDAEHEMVAGLQQGMLPHDVPQVAGLTTAARYLASTEGMQVGGDWYDVISVPGGGVSLVIGDVEGHSVRAAALMGQLRLGLRAYATEGHDPATVVARTNRLLLELDTELFATCCFVHLDTADGLMRIVRAGHPMPMLRSPNGETSTLEVAGGPPLGFASDTVYPVTEMDLPTDSVLALCTDGLIESRTMDLDTGVRHALERLAAADPNDMEGLANAMLGRLATEASRPDDVALLVTRYDAQQARSRQRTMGWTLPRSDMRGVAQARHLVVGTLRRWGVSDLIDATELLVSEVVTNGLVHGEGDVQLALTLEEGRLRVEVTDRTPLEPRLLNLPSDAASGRGLWLVNSMSSAWGTEPRGAGKAVWFELRQPGAAEAAGNGQRTPSTVPEGFAVEDLESIDDNDGPGEG